MPDADGGGSMATVKPMVMTAIVAGIALGSSWTARAQDIPNGALVMRSDGAIFLVIDGQRRQVDLFTGATDDAINALPEGERISTGVVPVSAGGTPQPPTSTNPLTAEVPEGTLTNDTWEPVLSDAEPFKGKPVRLVGRIFVNQEIGADRIAFQMYTTADLTDGNTVVLAPLGTGVKRNDYVYVEGTVYDKFEGENAFGAKLILPRVQASNVRVITRTQAVSPPLRTIQVDETLEQHGLAITLLRVEFAAKETRVYVRVRNDSGDKATVYTSSAALIQGSRQLEPKYVSPEDSGYPEFPSTMFPGVEAETLIVFDPIELNAEARFIWDGPRAGSYSLDFEPYVWTVGPA